MPSNQPCNIYSLPEIFADGKGMPVSAFTIRDKKRQKNTLTSITENFSALAKWLPGSFFEQPEKNEVLYERGHFRFSSDAF